MTKRCFQTGKKRNTGKPFGDLIWRFSHSDCGGEMREIKGNKKVQLLI